MRNRWLRILGIVVLVVLLIQFIPASKTNPPATQDFQAPEHIKSILQRACYDCHSHQTIWPWYSNVAPVSWLVTGHVNEGREYVNFSAWDKYSDRERIKIYEEIREVIEKDEMPLAPYRWMHPPARLTPADKSALIDWTGSPEVFKEKNSL